MSEYGAATNAIDNDPYTIWHTKYVGGSARRTSRTRRGHGHESHTGRGSATCRAAVTFGWAVDAAIRHGLREPTAG